MPLAVVVVHNIELDCLATAFCCKGFDFTPSIASINEQRYGSLALQHDCAYTSRLHPIARYAHLAFAVPS